jgi:hypothetical protein
MLHDRPVPAGRSRGATRLVEKRDRDAVFRKKGLQVGQSADGDIEWSQTPRRERGSLRGKPDG